MFDPTLCSRGFLAKSAGFKYLILGLREYTFYVLESQYLSARHVGKKTQMRIREIHVSL